MLAHGVRVYGLMDGGYVWPALKLGSERALCMILGELPESAVFTGISRYGGGTNSYKLGMLIHRGGERLGAQLSSQ